MAAAVLDTPPPTRAFSLDDTWITLQSAESVTARATIALQFSSTGPSAAQTIRLRWLGYDLTFTVSATDSESALDLPTIGALSLSDYALAVAERFAQNEIVMGYFAPEVLGAKVTLVQRVHEVVDITVNSTLSNTTVTVGDVTSLTQPDALRALVQVWSHTGALYTDRLLLSLHAPYNADLLAQMNIGPAFAGVAPHIPAENTIPAVALPTTQSFGVATTAQLSYYLRYADKSGTPAQAAALIRSENNYMALHGGKSIGALHNINDALRHSYRRTDGSIFPKPITDNTPDWIYWIPPAGVTQVYLSLLVDWSDGTQSLYDPYGSTGVTVVPGTLYWFSSGYRQMKLSSLTPGAGTDPEAYIVGYTAYLKRSDAGLLIGTHYVQYAIYRQGDWPAFHLLFANGVGGCEVVAMRGKTTVKSTNTAEEYTKPREADWTVIEGEFDTHSNTARTVWEVNTGWLPTTDYLHHLRQLPMGECWMIDDAQRKFRRVLVAPGEITHKTDDETLFSLSFTVRAAWTERVRNQ